MKISIVKALCLLSGTTFLLGLLVFIVNGISFILGSAAFLFFTQGAANALMTVVSGLVFAVTEDELRRLKRGP